MANMTGAETLTCGAFNTRRVALPHSCIRPYHPSNVTELEVRVYLPCFQTFFYFILFFFLLIGLRKTHNIGLVFRSLAPNLVPRSHSV